MWVGSSGSFFFHGKRHPREMGRLGYQWRFNSRPIPGATAASLTLSNVQLEQAGDYSVEVRNQFGTVVTPDARLTVVP